MVARHSFYEGYEARFERVREEVRAGAIDPAGLATASYGEQALFARDLQDDVATVADYAAQASQVSMNTIAMYN